MKTFILTLALPLAGNIFASASDPSTVKWLTPTTTHKTPKHLPSEAACNKKLYCGDKGASCGYDLCGCAACCPDNAVCTGCIKSMIYNPGVVNSCPVITPTTKRDDEVKVPIMTATIVPAEVTTTTNFNMLNAALITEAPSIANDNVGDICGGGCGTLLCTVDKCGCPACCSKGEVCTGCLNDIVINPAGHACPGYTITVDNAPRAVALDIVRVTNTALLTLTSTIAAAALMTPTAPITNDSYIGTPFAFPPSNTTTVVNSTSTSTSTTYPPVGHPPPSGIVPDTSTTTSTTDEFTSTTTSTASSASSSNQADHAGGSNPLAYIKSLFPYASKSDGTVSAGSEHGCSRSKGDCLCAYFEIGSQQEKACHEYLHSLGTDGEGSPVDVKVVKEGVRWESGSNGEGPIFHRTVGAAQASMGFGKEKGEVEVGAGFLLKGKGVTTQTTTRKERSVVTVTKTLSETMGHVEL